MIDEHAIGERFRALAGELNERQRRLWAGAEALSHGRGGQAAVVRATGLAEGTVRRGMREVQAGETIEEGRVRAPGGGPKALRETDPTLVADLERLVADEARGDPESPLRCAGAPCNRAVPRAGTLHRHRPALFRSSPRSRKQARAALGGLARRLLLCMESNSVSTQVQTSRAPAQLASDLIA